MIYENNEEKRSTLWRTVLTVSSVVIVIILIFFIVKLFTGNPLEGSWVSEDSGAVLVIGDDGEVTLTGDAEDEENTSMSYTVDTKNKIFTPEIRFPVVCISRLSPRGGEIHHG